MNTSEITDKKLRKAMRISRIKWNFNLVFSDILENTVNSISEVRMMLNKRCGFCKVYDKLDLTCGNCIIEKTNICDEISMEAFDKKTINVKNISRFVLSSLDHICIKNF